MLLTQIMRPGRACMLSLGLRPPCGPNCANTGMADIDSALEPYSRLPLTDRYRWARRLSQFVKLFVNIQPNAKIGTRALGDTLGSRSSTIQRMNCRGLNSCTDLWTFPLFDGFTLAGKAAKLHAYAQGHQVECSWPAR